MAKQSPVDGGNSGESTSDWSEEETERKQKRNMATKSSDTSNIYLKKQTYALETDSEIDELELHNADENESAETIRELRESVRELPLGKLEVLRKSGFGGQPLFQALGFQSHASLNKWLAGRDVDEKIPTRISDSLHNQETSKKKKKGKKGAPLEITSKRRVSRSRQVIPIKKAGSRDPRFHDLFGEFKPNLFNKSYAFLDEYKTREIEEIERRLQQDRDLRRKNSKQRRRKKLLTEEERGRMMSRLTRFQQDRAKREREHLSQVVKSRLNKEEREKVAEGIKKPFYLKKREIKKVELEEQYKVLKEKGKLDRYIAKRRKKLSDKDRKLLPRQKLYAIN